MANGEWRVAALLICSRPLDRRSGTDALQCVGMQQALERKERRRRTAVRLFAALLCVDWQHCCASDWQPNSVNKMFINQFLHTKN